MRLANAHFYPPTKPKTMNNTTPRRPGTYIEAWVIWLAGFGFFAYFLRFIIALIHHLIQ